MTDTMDDTCASGLNCHLELSSSLPHCVPPCLPSCLNLLSSSTASPSSSSSSLSRVPSGTLDLEDVCGDQSVLLLLLSRSEKRDELSPSHVCSDGHFPPPLFSKPPLFGNLACVSALVWAVGEEPLETTPEALRRHCPPEIPEFLVRKRLVRIGGSEIPPGMSDVLLHMRPGDVVRVCIHSEKGFKGMYPRTLRQAVVEDDFLLADVCLHYWTLFDNLTPSPLLSSFLHDRTPPWASPTRLEQFATSPRSFHLCSSSAPPLTEEQTGEDQRKGGTKQNRGEFSDKGNRGKAGEEGFPKDLVLFYAYDRLKRDSRVSDTWRDVSSNVLFSYHTFNAHSTTDTLDLARVEVSYALLRPHFPPSTARSPSSPTSSSSGSTSCRPNPIGRVPPPLPVSSYASAASFPVLFHANPTSLEDETTPQVFEFLLDEDEAPYRGIEVIVRNLRVGQAGDAWLSGKFAQSGKTAGSVVKDQKAKNRDGDTGKAGEEEGHLKANGQRAATDKEEMAIDRGANTGEESKVTEQSGAPVGNDCPREAGSNIKLADGENNGKLSYSYAGSGGSSTTVCSPDASAVEKRTETQEGSDPRPDRCEDANEREEENKGDTNMTVDETEEQGDCSARCCRLLRGFVIRCIHPLPEPHHMPTPETKISMAKFIRENGNCWFRRRNFERALRRYLMSEKYLIYLGGEASHSDTQRARPDLQAVRLNAAQCCNALGNFDQAKTFCEKVLKEDPENIKGLWRLSVALAGKGDYLKAESTAQQALAFQPQNPEMLQWLSYLKKQGEEEDERLLGGFKGILCSSESNETKATN